jgi:hypothetical protein
LTLRPGMVGFVQRGSSGAERRELKAPGGRWFKSITRCWRRRPSPRLHLKAPALAIRRPGCPEVRNAARAIHRPAAKLISDGVEQRSARQSHKLEVAGSNPAPGIGHEAAKLDPASRGRITTKRPRLPVVLMGRRGFSFLLSASTSHRFSSDGILDQRIGLRYGRRTTRIRAGQFFRGAEVSENWQGASPRPGSVVVMRHIAKHRRPRQIGVVRFSSELCRALRPQNRRGGGWEISLCAQGVFLPFRRWEQLNGPINATTSASPRAGVACCLSAAQRSGQHPRRGAARDCRLPEGGLSLS